MTEAGDAREPSVLGSVPPFAWSDEHAVDFEVAQDTISRFIAECTARYWAERRKVSPDPVIVERWDQEGRIASEARHALRADDPDGVRAAIETYGQRLRELSGGAE